VKNYLIVLSPDCLEKCVSVESLESLLHLGVALADKSSVGRMRDSSALKLFSLSNCLKCLNGRHVGKFMFLIPWALQTEVVRNGQLSREEQLMKAVLALNLLSHYFDPSCLPRADGVTQRFVAEKMTAVTFPED
jgi:hypothetical protein